MQYLQVGSISPQEAQKLAKSGKWVLVDVRPSNEYEAARIPGSQSAPIYQPLDMSKADFGRLLKFATMKANGVNPTEPNPDFVEDIKKAAGGKGVIITCETGGTLTPSKNFATGACDYPKLLSIYLSALYMLQYCSLGQDPRDNRTVDAT